MKRENSISSIERSRPPLSSRDENSMMDMQVQPSRDISTTWRSMQTGFRNFKSNMESKGFIPFTSSSRYRHSRASQLESLDEIFDRIKRPGAESTNYDSDDDVYDGLKSSSFAEIMDDNPALSQFIFAKPTEYLPLFDEAAVWAQKVIFADLKQCENASVKDNIHVRINISGSPLECPETFSQHCRVRAKHRGFFLISKGL
ncbi:hypothetical protein HAX54_036821 [Datura stramonium]|uniref:MCM9 N-terminal domain-containing protein n=1 Tax=Datura stramonium TaxID=4076 RepID=A0ABS8RP33_DATST|nr:hypothetical protein [Datura stramonium]